MVVGPRRTARRRRVAIAGVRRHGSATKLGIVGAGFIGRAIAALGVRAGYQVMIGNSRHPRTLGSPVVALGVPFCAIADLPPGPFAAKPVLEANNYYPHRDGAIAALDAAQRGVELPHGCWRG